jgi:hypothetical protein
VIQSAHFTATVEAPDLQRTGGAPRLVMPRTEAALSRAILAAKSCAPEFSIVLRPGAPDATRATLASLARQAYAAFDITADASARAQAAAMDDLAGRLAPPDTAAKGTKAKKPSTRKYPA